jgi:SAM-dependent methyltransferase
MLVMFAAENAVRHRALPHMPHAGLIATIRASAAVGLGGSRSPATSGRKLRKSLARRAAAYYRPSGLWAYFFASFKLTYDPFYAVLLAEGLIPAGVRILDLGCAQGLLAAWLRAARQSFAEGIWDDASPVPPFVEAYRGVDRNGSEIRRAQLALRGHADFATGDITAEPVAGATLVVLLDVLHYLGFEQQVELLRRIRAALPAQGVLLLRVGDSDGSLRARISLWVDYVVIRLRGGGGALSRRRIAEWIALLNDSGFDVREIARQRSPGYVNCVLRALPGAA